MARPNISSATGSNAKIEIPIGWYATVSAVSNIYIQYTRFMSGD